MCGPFFCRGGSPTRPSGIHGIPECDGVPIARSCRTVKGGSVTLPYRWGDRCDRRGGSSGTLVPAKPPKKSKMACRSRHAISSYSAVGIVMGAQQTVTGAELSHRGGGCHIVVFHRILSFSFFRRSLSCDDHNTWSPSTAKKGGSSVRSSAGLRRRRHASALQPLSGRAS